MQYDKKGFGYVYQNVMRDKKLTVEAKAIYAYLASFAGNNEMCYPGTSLMMDELPMSKERFYKHMNLLVEKGIIIKQQELDGTKFSKNTYTLNSFPSFPTTEFPRTEIEDTGFPTTENTTTKRNSSKTNSFNSNSFKNDIVDTAVALPTTPKFSDDSFEILVVESIIHSCLQLYPNSKVPSTYSEKEKWAIEVERMKRIDGRTEEDIKQALQFAVNDNFWKPNIRSTKKFREKFETLIIQSKQKKASSTKQTTEDFYNTGKEWLSERTTISSNFFND